MTKTAEEEIRQALEDAIRLGLVVYNAKTDTYRLTPKGEAYADKLKSKGVAP